MEVGEKNLFYRFAFGWCPGLGPEKAGLCLLIWYTLLGIIAWPTLAGGYVVFVIFLYILRLLSLRNRGHQPSGI